MKNGASSVAHSVIQSWADAVNKAVETMLRTVGTFWMKIPSPAGNTPAVAKIEHYLGWCALAAMVLGVLLCAARMALSGRGEHGIEAGKMLVRVTLISGAALSGMTLANQFGDSFSQWIMRKAIGASFTTSMQQAVEQMKLSALSAALTIFLGIFMIFGALAMLVAAAFRWVALVLLMGFWPLAASLSATEQGASWYKKINGWVLAYLLLKPVAAVVYAAGFLLMKGGGAVPGKGSELLSVIMGMLLLAAAGLTLPALLKLISPHTDGAAGTSGAAIAGGMVATGASVAALAGGGAAGGAAAGGGASGGGAGASGASMPAGGAAGGGGGGGQAGGGAGGGSGKGPTGPSGGGGSSGGGSGGGGSGGGSSSGGGGSSSSGASEPASSGGPSGTSAESTQGQPSPSGGAAMGNRMTSAMGQARGAGGGGSSGGGSSDDEDEGPTGAETRGGET